MHPSSSSSSPSIPNCEIPKGGVRRDAGSGGTIPVNGTAVYPDTPKSSVPSFAAIVSSSSPSGKTNSPFSSSTKTPSSTFFRQKHPQPPGPSRPLGDNSNDNKNSFINSTSFTTGNGIAINTSAQSTIASSSSAASPSSFRPNSSEGDTPIDNSNDDVENDQEDSESSDVEIYLNSFDSDNSTTRMNVLSGTSTLQFFFLVHSSRIYASFWRGYIIFSVGPFVYALRSSHYLDHSACPTCCGPLHFLLRPFSRSPTWPPARCMATPLHLTRIHICATYSQEA